MPERWSAIERLFQEALERPGAEREAFLRAACDGDDDLRREIESLLANERGAAFLSTPALAMADQEPIGRLLTGQRLGPYAVGQLLGAGGMGEVYRARDTKLDRDVAIKILPRAFVSDSDRLARFRREARTLALFNDPGIGGVYGLEEWDDVPALVLELVEGETLAERLRRGPLPIHETLDIARQIARALDAAHEKGIIHRDLKPANIKITPTRQVKLLDFGIAKIGAEHGTGSILTTASTREGMVIGTPAYMSPEQARGQAVDKRTDIWAFGCVLYEMLAGHSAFSRDTTTDTLAAIVEADPDWSALPPDTPAHVVRLLRRCLEKDSAKRLRDIGDGRPELDDVAGATGLSDVGTVIAPHRRREYAAWSAGAIGLVALAVSLVLWRADPTPMTPPRVVRTTLVLPVDQRVASRGGDYSLAMSPDGSRFAYVGEVDGQAQLYVRELDALEATALAGTDGARHPFFSPDGQWIGFFAGGALQRVAVKGGAPLRICNVSGVSEGGSWGPHDRIVFATRDADLAQVNVAGGGPQPLSGSGPASWPQLLPDGKTVLFTVGDGVGDAIATVSLDQGPKRIIARTSDSKTDGPAVIGSGGDITQVRYVPSGHLVYGQDPGTIRAVAFDRRTMTVTGPPVSMVDGVERANNGGAVYFAVSETGSLVYASSGDRHQLVWVERNGSETPVSPDHAAFRHPRLSPDGKHIAVAVYDETRHPFIWLYDVDRGTKLPLNAEGLEPAWSADGTRLALGTEHGAIVAVPVDGTGVEEELVPKGPFRWPTSWSQDGQHLLFYQNEKTGVDLWLLERASASTPRNLKAGPSSYWGMISPDARWIAYVSNESGRAEVYVARFSGLANKVVVSTDGGTRPRWSRDGRELFYRQGDGMMAVSIDVSHGFSMGKPRRLFGGPYAGEGRDPAFDVTADASRFLMIKTDPVATLQRLTLVQNWSEELKRAGSAPGK